MCARSLALLAVLCHATSASPAVLPLLAPSTGIQTDRQGVAFAPSPLPASNALAKGERIVELFAQLSRSSTFTTVQEINFGQIVEAEGMVRVGADRYFISNNEYSSLPVQYPGGPRDGTDRSAGAGQAFLAVYDGSGSRIARVALSEIGSDEYHNGGIDYDGKYIYCNIAQYRPNSTFSLIRVDPLTLQSTFLARYADHGGGPIVGGPNGRIYNLNWGSRKATVAAPPGSRAPAFPAFATPAAPQVVNPSSYVDYQDCKSLGRIRKAGGRELAFCSGIATYGATSLGGLAIVDIATLTPLYEVPVTNRGSSGAYLTQNPSDVDINDQGGLRFWFFPDQATPLAKMYVVDAQP